MDFERRPVATMLDLSTLDEAEIVEGYRDGFAGWDCGNNRSRSYWHGWRNAQSDRGKTKPDDAQANLVREYLARPRPLPTG